MIEKDAVDLVFKADLLRELVDEKSQEDAQKDLFVVEGMSQYYGIKLAQLLSIHTIVNNSYRLI